MEDQEPLVIPATAVQEGILRWISSNGPGRRAGAGIGRTVSAFNRRRLGAMLDDEPWTPLRRPVASAMRLCESRSTQSREPAVPPRSSGHPHRRLGFDDLGRSPVLLGQPSVAEVQVELRRGDRTMPGLCLERFDGHACFAQTRETGVAKLMAGPMRQPGAQSECPDHSQREREALPREPCPLGRQPRARCRRTCTHEWCTPSSTFLYPESIRAQPPDSFAIAPSTISTNRMLVR